MTKEIDFFDASFGSMTQNDSQCCHNLYKARDYGSLDDALIENLAELYDWCMDLFSEPTGYTTQTVAYEFENLFDFILNKKNYFELRYKQEKQRGKFGKGSAELKQRNRFRTICGDMKTLRTQIQSSVYSTDTRYGAYFNRTKQAVLEKGVLRTHAEKQLSDKRTRLPGDESLVATAVYASIVDRVPSIINTCDFDIARIAKTFMKLYVNEDERTALTLVPFKVHTYFGDERFEYRSDQ